MPALLARRRLTAQPSVELGADIGSARFHIPHGQPRWRARNAPRSRSTTAPWRSGSASTCAWPRTASFQAFARLSQEVGVRPGRFATLTLIGNNPGISQTALSRANGRDKSTPHAACSTDLVRRGGWCAGAPHAPGDRRTYRLTADARAARGIAAGARPPARAITRRSSTASSDRATVCGSCASCARWRPASSEHVVPAKAGTHTPCPRGKSSRVGGHSYIDERTEYGSRLSPGRH